MATLIDSSVLIAAERGQLDFKLLTTRYADEEMAISAITASELLHGVHRSRTTAQKSRRQAFVEPLLARIPVVAFDLVVARLHSSLWADLAKRGISVGERDLMIGATAIAKGYGVTTRDHRSFPKIPGLKVDQIVSRRQRVACVSSRASLRLRTMYSTSGGPITNGGVTITASPPSVGPAIPIDG
jgi:tRNA(fMet)-specific endonuclease VapC